MSTEIEAVSKWSTNDVLQYWSSRMPPGIYLPMVLFLGMASLTAGWPTRPASLVVNLLLAYSLVLQFRLWDDLSDVERDRVEHPERTLCRTKRMKLFRWILFGLFVMNFGLIVWLKPVNVVVVFLSLNWVFWLWYRMPQQNRLNDWLSYHFVLLKYPIFVYLIRPDATGTATGSLLLAMVLVYLCFCVYEVLHDPSLRTFRGINIWLAVEMIALELVAILIVVDASQFAQSWGVVPITLLFVGAGLFAFLFYLHRYHTVPGRWCYSVFLIGFVSLWNGPLLTYPMYQTGLML